jgi:putative tricarboxylic transport membrane protein
MNAERIVSVIWLIVGGAVMHTSYGLGFGSGGEPGSGFLPMIAGGFICAMAVIVYIQTYKNKKMAESRFADHWRGTDWHRAVILVLLTIAFISLIEVLGYFVTSILLLVIIMKALEKLSWFKSIFIPIVTVTLTYLLFTSMLDTNMPRGVLGLW